MKGVEDIKGESTHMCMKLLWRISASITLLNAVKINLITAVMVEFSNYKYVH